MIELLDAESVYESAKFYGNTYGISDLKYLLTIKSFQKVIPLSIALKTKTPFVEGEKLILQYPVISYVYAVKVLKNRFKLGEKTIKESNYSELYCEFLKSILTDEEYIVFKLEY